MNLEAIILSIVLPVLVLCMVLAAVRLVRGPHILDRVLALDFMIVVGVGMLGFYAVATNQPSFIDVAVVVALLSFLGTIGFAYYVEARGSRQLSDTKPVGAFGVKHEHPVSAAFQHQEPIEPQANLADQQRTAQQSQWNVLDGQSYQLDEQGELS